MGEYSKAGVGYLSTGGFFVTVAIIMRSMNEQPYVEQVFEMLRRQTYRDFTVYSVDSGSTDGTWECVCTENPRAEKRRRIRPDQYIPGKVLNETIELAREPIIVLLNADAVPLSSTWLEELIKPLMNGKAEATLSRQVARKDARFIVRNDYERAYDPGRYAEKPLDLFSAVSCGFQRTLWEQYPFPSEGYAEDWAWFQECSKGGARFLFVPGSVVEHSHNYSLKALYRKRYRQAKTFARVDGEGAYVVKQSLAAFKEMGRDFCNAVSSFQFHTIPYNLAYRCVIHAALYQGRKQANG